MRARLLAGFRSGSGLVSPALIVVWFGLGIGLLLWQWSALHGIESYSGNVTSLTPEQNDTKFALDSSSIDFYLAADTPHLDVQVGDHVDILTFQAITPDIAMGGGKTSADVVARGFRSCHDRVNRLNGNSVTHGDTSYL